MMWFGRLVLACAALSASVAHAQTSYYQPVARLESPTPVRIGAFGLGLVADDGWAAVRDSGKVVQMVRLHDGTAEVVQTLTHPEPASGHDFGYDLAISGDTLAVSDTAYACSAGAECGAVFIFVRRDERWEFDARIDSPVPTRRDEFGEKLALENDTLVVQSAGKRPGVVEAGLLDVFEREEGVFRHRQALQPAGLPRRAAFGEALSISGDTILAGASRDTLDGVVVGGAYVMKRGETGWTQDARLVDPTQQRLGTTVAIHGDMWLVRDYLDADVGHADSAGSVRVFRRIDGEVRQIQKIVDPSPERKNDFSTPITLQGDRMWVGASFKTIDAYDYGTVQVFRVENDEVTWLEELRSPGGANEDRFGARMAVSGRYLLVSAFDDSTSLERAGAVHVFYDTRVDDGGACSESAACLNGQCVDGMCCATACDTSGGCMACRGDLTGGSDGSCEPVLAGTACGVTEAEICSAPDSCDGRGACLDNHIADGTTCEDGLFCSAGDMCQAGQCVAGVAAACAEDLACVEAEAACLSVCGDGLIQRGEACDDGVDNSDTVANACRSTCQLAACGDGVVDAAEGCDDGAQNSDERLGACRTDCRPAHCGDGVVDDGEQCDTGTRNDDTRADACRTTCVIAACGDGVVDQGEACDQGSANSDVQADQCRKDCQAARCGDGVVDQGEACDEGAASDTCSAACTLPSCTGSACDDAGVPEHDAGVPEHDAGGPNADAGTPAPEADAGPDTKPEEPGGCSVTSASSSTMFASLSWLVAVFVLRRRRSPGAFTPSSR